MTYVGLSGKTKSIKTDIGGKANTLANDNTLTKAYTLAYKPITQSLYVK